MIQALNHLQQEQSEEVVNEVAQFVCRTYCPKNTPKHITNSIVETRYFLYKKFSADTNKLPPTVGAFTQHIKRASCQLLVWVSAHMSEIAKPDPLNYGGEKCDGDLFPICTKDLIAPEDIIELVACNCKGKCIKDWCKCRKNKEACTEFCGCGDECMNSDMDIPENIDAQDEDLDLESGTETL